MKLSQFAATYGRGRLPPSNHYRGEHTHDFIDDVRAREIPYQDILTAYTHGETLDTGRVQNEVETYRQWAQGKFATNIADITERLDQEGKTDPKSLEELSSVIAETAFVLMNFALGDSWVSLASGEPLNRSQVHRAQLCLGLATIPRVEYCESMVQDGTFFKRNEDGGYWPHQIALATMAASNESDSALVMLEALTKTDPHKLVLPAPGFYEHGSPHRFNADLLAIDALKRLIVPVQVKSYLKRETAGSYSSDMAFVDAAVDFGNVRALRLPKRSSSLQVPWGGLISVHSIANEKDLYRLDMPKGKAYRPGARQRELSILSQAARRLAKTAKPHNKDAVRIIRERIEAAFNTPDLELEPRHK